MIGNLFLAYFSQPGHATPDDDRTAYSGWILAQVEEIWDRFRSKFLALWKSQGQGDSYVTELFADPASAAALSEHRETYMQALLQDSLGFAGMKMVRRILGLAHVEDLESIEDPDLRAACETKALLLGRELIVNRQSFDNVAAVASYAQQLQRGAEQ